MRPRPDAMRPRSRPRPERVRPRLRPNDLASRPHEPRCLNSNTPDFVQCRVCSLAASHRRCHLQPTHVARSVVSVRLCVRHTGDLAKMAEPIEIPFPDRLVLRQRNRALDGTHINATLRIRLNDPNAELTNG